MKIIYHCYGGSHSSVVASAIHLGLIPDDRMPTVKELQNLPYFDGQVAKDHGQIRFMGEDENRNEIYIMGRRNYAPLMERVLTGVSTIIGVPEGELVLVNVMPYVNWRMVMGGFTSRRLGLISLGRPVVTKGVQNSFFYIASMVQQVKAGLKGVVRREN